jgi:hypothetical protein
MTTRYCVTKQIQYPDGDRVVEISIGTFDYVNPDCLSDDGRYMLQTHSGYYEEMYNKQEAYNAIR